ncbi:MAG TPA: glutamate synthase subunit alpha, partial [Cyclobacteriaceae bacterium]|nr:glutamate synthase subunit alpha [Cyclobacteriaceae bacterium]
IMAELGFRTVNEMVGQADRLEMRKDEEHWKYHNLNLSPLLFKEPMSLDTALFKQEEQDHGIEAVLDRKLIKLAKPALTKAERVQGEFVITNQDRAVGAMLSNEISKIYLGPGLPADTVQIKFNGTAGQSFGAFVTGGVTFELEGDANDYFGKGLSGGKMILYPSTTATFNPSKNIIVGNVAFFGATAGEAFIKGMAGERFAVRNSGVKVVVEGVGDHGCEYMTGGTVVILGDTGRNFAAGMSGGVAYVWDVNKTFVKNCNMEMVLLDTLDEEDEHLLHSMIEQHKHHTNSEVAAHILSYWTNTYKNFIKVMPIDYKKVLEKRKAEKKSTTAQTTFGNTDFKFSSN